MSDRFTTTGEMTLDTNVSDGASAELAVLPGATRIAVYLFDKTGDHGTHIVQLQVSPDGTNYLNSGQALTGLGHVDSHVCLCTHARLKISTPEGGTSTVKAFILAA